MKIIAFLGSPRIDGNSDLLLTETLKAIKEEGHTVTVYRPYKMNFSPCISCHGCRKTGICVINDDMTEVYNDIREADRFIIASPVYFFSLPAGLKALIDRCQCFWVEKYILKKNIQRNHQERKGLLMLLSAMKKESIFQCCDLTVTAFFNTISVPKHNILTCGGIDEKGDIINYPVFLKDACEAGKKLVSEQ